MLLITKRVTKLRHDSVRANSKRIRRDLTNFLSDGKCKFIFSILINSIYSFGVLLLQNQPINHFHGGVHYHYTAPPLPPTPSNNNQPEVSRRSVFDRLGSRKLISNAICQEPKPNNWKLKNVKSKKPKQKNSKARRRQKEFFQKKKMEKNKDADLDKSTRETPVPDKLKKD